MNALRSEYKITSRVASLVPKIKDSDTFPHGAYIKDRMSPMKAVTMTMQLTLTSFKYLLTGTWRPLMIAVTMAMPIPKLRPLLAIPETAAICPNMNGGCAIKITPMTTAIEVEIFVQLIIWSFKIILEKNKVNTGFENMMALASPRGRCSPERKLPNIMDAPMNP